MAVTIFLSRLAVTWLIVLKQLDEAIVSLMAQLKHGQAEQVQLSVLSPQSKIASKKCTFSKFYIALKSFSSQCLWFLQYPHVSVLISFKDIP
jgi:hypothetical protein